MALITLDFETYWDSRCYTLSKMSAIEYVRDARFHAQMMGVRIDRGPVSVFEHEQIPEALKALDLSNPAHIVVGHNINGFDGLILSEVYECHPACILDTMVMMRWCGLSRVMQENLKTLTHHFRCGEKKAGTVVSDGKRTKAEFDPAEWEFFKQYCADDVQQTSDCCFKMLPFMTADAILFASITAKMATEPALVLNKPLLEEYVAEVNASTAAARVEISHLFHFETDEEFQKAIRSAPSFCAMLRQLGAEPPMKISEAKTATRKAELEAKAKGDSVTARLAQQALDEGDYQVYAPSLSKQDIDFLNMQEHPDERVALLVRTRLENNSSIAKSRGEKLIRMAEYGKPLPVMLKAYHAHTSRYGAGNSEGKTDGVQIQNLPKRDPKMLKLRQGIRVPAGYKLVAADSSQIEARMLAYLANQQDLLDAFRNGADPYADLAEKIFGVPSKEIHDGAKGGDKRLKTYRNVGKTAILSAGYGTSAIKYSNTLLRQGVKLDEEPGEHEKAAKQAHAVYRANNRAIVNFWYYCQKVIDHILEGGEGYFGGPNDCVFHYGTMDVPGMDDTIPSIEMPSGYKLRYPGLRAEPAERGYECFFDKPLGRNIVKTRIYGPMLTENLTQGISFQLLMWQACRMMEAGINIKGNIHDAFFTIVPESDADATLKVMLDIMKTPPPWLPGIPIDAEGEVADDFTVA